MTDRILIELTNDWALGADSQQWIIIRVTEPEKRTRAYRPIAFIGCTKSALIRSMQRKNIEPTTEALAKINAWPEKFLDWRDQYKSKVSI